MLPNVRNETSGMAVYRTIMTRGEVRRQKSEITDDIVKKRSYRRYNKGQVHGKRSSGRFKPPELATVTISIV